MNKTFISQTSARFCSGHPWPSRKSPPPRLLEDPGWRPTAKWWIAASLPGDSNCVLENLATWHSFPGAGFMPLHRVMECATVGKVVISYLPYHTVSTKENGLLSTTSPGFFSWWEKDKSFCDHSPLPCVPTTIFKSILAPAILHQPRY